jgi:hypothetical protein
MRTIIEVTDTTYTVEVPITIRRRNGRPKIVLPDDGDQASSPERDNASATVLRAIARAWDWRRRLETGEAATLQDIARAEKVTLAFVARYIRLSYLAPHVMDEIVHERQPVVLSLERLIRTAKEKWQDQ